MAWTRASSERSRREEFDEVIVDAVGRFDLYGVTGRERLGVNEVARIFAPYCRILLGRWRAARRYRAPSGERGRRFALALRHAGLAGREHVVCLRALDEVLDRLLP